MVIISSAISEGGRRLTIATKPKAYPMRRFFPQKAIVRSIIMAVNNLNEPHPLDNQITPTLRDYGPYIQKYWNER